MKKVVEKAGEIQNNKINGMHLENSVGGEVSEKNELKWKKE